MVRLTTLIVILSAFIAVNASAQNNAYNTDLYPDLWYNGQDGIRAGVRVLGNMEGTFLEGRHRLDAGLWIASKWPDMPVSYYVSLTEPLPGMMEAENEGSIEFVSSIREGYSAHSVLFHKRWQAGFNELNHSRLTFLISQEKLTDPAYRHFAQLWQNDWKSLIGVSYALSREPSLGSHRSEIHLLQNVNPASGSFSTVQAIIRQQIRFSKYSDIRVRAFAGFLSADGAPEYRFLSSVPTPQNWMHRGISRSEGTIPDNWLTRGLVQFSGGANLRGYIRRDMEELNAGGDPSLRSVAALNTEFRFRNGLDKWLDDVTVVGDLIDLRTYVFADLGVRLADGPANRPLYGATEQIVSDAGIGLELSINIPDYLGQNRGIFIRYDVPLWLSDPLPGEQSFKYRQLIGIGAIISL